MSHLRRVALAPVLAMALVLTLASTVSAASSSLTIVSGTCTSTGGQWGHGVISVMVRASEQGLSSARRVVFIASLMHQSRSAGGAWKVNQTQQHIAHLPAGAAGVQSRIWNAVWNLGGDVATYHHR